MPAISSDNLFAAGTTAVLLGLRRDLTRGDVANLGVVNLAQQAAQCQVKLFRADGSQIATTATLTFKPLSLRSFGDAFGLLGEQQAADARAEVSCNQPFYAYATQYSGASSQLSFILPAASGTSTLTAPGAAPPARRRRAAATARSCSPRRGCSTPPRPATRRRRSRSRSPRRCRSRRW